MKNFCNWIWYPILVLRDSLNREIIQTTFIIICNLKDITLTLTINRIRFWTHDLDITKICW